MKIALIIALVVVALLAILGLIFIVVLIQVFREQRQEAETQRKIDALSEQGSFWMLEKLRAAYRLGNATDPAEVAEWREKFTAADARWKREYVAPLEELLKNKNS